MSKNKTETLTKIALMTALIAVTTQIAIPTPSGVPITLQTFAVAFCGYVLGMKHGLTAVGLYLSLGAVGLPVFSNFRGGIYMLTAAPSSGFLYGFLLLALFCGLADTLKYRRAGMAYLVLVSLAGLLLCHLCGVMMFAAIMQVSPVKAFVVSSLPYLLKDSVSVALAYVLAVRLSKLLRIRR